jgi:hypothetical protein
MPVEGREAGLERAGEMESWGGEKMRERNTRYVNDYSEPCNSKGEGEGTRERSQMLINWGLRTERGD